MHLIERRQPARRAAGRAVRAAASVAAVLGAAWCTVGSAGPVSATTTGGSSAAGAPTGCLAPAGVSAGATLTLVPSAATASAVGTGKVVGTEVAPTGTSSPLVARCSWRATFRATPGFTPDSKSVTYTGVTATYMALGTSYTFHIHGDGVSCTSTGEVLNGFGGGGAQAELVSTYCNTASGFPTGLGYVKIVGSTYATGTLERLSHFGTPVTTSFVSGHTVFYGSFQDCSEEPVGQTTHFDCVYWNGGPFS